MDKEKANKLLELYGRPAVDLGKGKTLVFARQSENDIYEIEAMSTEDLIEEWKGLVWTNNIYGQVSLNDLQRISLIELEFEARELDPTELSDWYEQEKRKFEESENGDQDEQE